jgi:hypothetical protein
LWVNIVNNFDFHTAENNPAGLKNQGEKAERRKIA